MHLLWPHGRVGAFLSRAQPGPPSLPLSLPGPPWRQNLKLTSPQGYLPQEALLTSLAPWGRLLPSALVTRSVGKNHHLRPKHGPMWDLVRPVSHELCPIAGVSGCRDAVNATGFSLFVSALPWAREQHFRDSPPGTPRPLSSGAARTPGGALEGGARSQAARLLAPRRPQTWAECGRRSRRKPGEREGRAPWAPGLPPRPS